MAQGLGVPWGEAKWKVIGGQDPQPLARGGELRVPEKTLSTVGGIQGSRVGPQSPARGRLAPRAEPRPPPGAAGGCSSERPP